MNCLDYRRELGADPRRESGAMQTHRRECAGCAAHQARSLGFELELRRALQVPTPAGLTERILLAQATRERRGRALQHRRVLWGVAAALVLAVGLGLLSLIPGKSLADQLVEHIAHEPQAFATRAAMPDAEVLTRFAARGVVLAAALPAGISYAAACPVGKHPSVHMVMSPAEGPVTVFYLPTMREQRREFHKGSLHGRELPLAEGTLVMLADNSASFDAIELAWRQTLEGSRHVSAGAP